MMDSLDIPEIWAEDLRAWANDCWAQAACDIDTAAQEAFARLAAELEAKSEQLIQRKGHLPRA